MCSVIGFYGHASERVATRLDALLRESRIRGLHAFGIASVVRDVHARDSFLTPRTPARESALGVRPVDALALASEREHALARDVFECARFRTSDDARSYLRVLLRAHEHKPMILIGHCRYSTSGDWREPSNNQPIVIEGVALAFNGVIRMTTNTQWGKEFGFTPQTDNDGEIFVRKVLDGANWEEWVAHGAFSFAGVMLHASELVALRNRQRPLYHVRDGRSHYIGSTADIFHRAGFHNPREIPAGETFHVGKLS